jgi:hypothetical protein
MDLRGFLTAARAPEYRLGVHEYDIHARPLAGCRRVNPLPPFDRVSFPSDKQAGRVSLGQGASPPLRHRVTPRAQRYRWGALPSTYYSGSPGVAG